MEDEKIRRINAFLTKHKTSCDILPKNYVTELLLVDDAIHSRMANIKEAENVIKQQSINITNISLDTNLSRKTFYNNGLLELYVKHYAAKLGDDKAESNEKIGELNEKVADLESALQELLLRDVESGNLRKELETTQRELANQITLNEGLKRKCEELMSEKDVSALIASIRNNDIVLPKKAKKKK